MTVGMIIEGNWHEQASVILTLFDISVYGETKTCSIILATNILTSTVRCTTLMYVSDFVFEWFMFHFQCHRRCRGYILFQSYVRAYLRIL